MKVTGRCHCGQISFEAEIDPAQVRVCHCTDCQTLTGTAFRTNVASLPGTFVLKSGTPKIYIKTAESGNQRAHGFCPDCGTPLYSVAPGPNPPSYGLRVGDARPPRRIEAGAAGLVPLGPAVVDGFDQSPAIRAAMRRASAALTSQAPTASTRVNSATMPRCVCRR